MLAADSMDRQFRDAVGCRLLAKAEICWKITYSLPSLVSVVSNSCCHPFQYSLMNSK